MLALVQHDLYCRGQWLLFNAGALAQYAGLLLKAKVAALAGIYLLAGVPGMVEVCEHVAAGEVTPHVLMMLSALGTVILGKAFEVGARFFSCAASLGTLVNFNSCILRNC